MSEVLEIKIKTDAPKAKVDVDALQKSFGGLDAAAMKAAIRVQKSATPALKGAGKAAAGAGAAIGKKTLPAMKDLTGAAQAVEGAIASGVNPSLSGLLATSAAGGPVLIALAAAVAVVAAGFVAVKTSIDLAADAAPLLLVEGAFQSSIERTQAMANSLQDFEALSQTAFGTGADGADRMLSALQAASAGMINNTELMKQFNQATQLVGIEFAGRLPEAMEHLQSVSASTGQSLDFLMNSLTTGIGRLSPMILDNLGITVDTTAAYQDYARSIGLTASQLSKEQQQTALMNQVMERLAKNTAGMPSLAGTATQAFAAFGASGENIKKTIGGAFAELYAVALPLLTAGLDSVDTLLKAMTKAAGPGLKEIKGAFQDLAKAFKDPEMQSALEEYGKAYGEIIAAGLPLMLSEAVGALTVMAKLVATHGPQMIEMFTKLLEVIEKVASAAGQVKMGVSMAMGQQLPGFANGVSGFRGGMAMVGERGPEMVQLPAGASVYNTTSSPLNNYGSMNFNVNSRATFGSLARQARTAAGPR